MAEITTRDLRIAQEKNQKYKKQIDELQDLLRQSQYRNTQLQGLIEAASKIGESHVKRAGEQLDSTQGMLRRCRHVITTVETALEDPTIASPEVVKREFVDHKLDQLRKAVGHEVAA